METLITRHQRLLASTSAAYVRSLMEEIHWDARLIAIRGARGVGKTTLLLQYLKLHYPDTPQTALYASLDSLYFARHTLSELAEQFYLKGGKHLFLDEVHKYPGWSREIKNIYDEYPELRIVFTGSSLLNILNAEADLSRRCIAYNMQGLSFREFLHLRHGLPIRVYPLDEVLANANELCGEVNGLCRPLAYFDEYLRTGYYPFYLEGEGDYYTRIENVVNMILELELPQLCGVEMGNVRKLKSLLAILASEVPFSVDISKLSSMAGLGRTTLLTYLQYMDRAGLIKLLYSDLASVKKMQKPDKIYLENPNLLYALSPKEVNQGTLREAFLLNQLAYRHRMEYSDRAADFTVDGQFTIEVGGKSKGGKQVAGIPAGYIASDNTEYAVGNKIPLWAFGMEY
ncbi:MAG: AAA family ATPase [Mediterranea sp.]|jgi:predicted AAA+ superfamily ATPase|nr:AAA family ATPase [Mediterranea sp.]